MLSYSGVAQGGVTTTLPPVFHVPNPNPTKIQYLCGSSAFLYFLQKKPALQLSNLQDGRKFFIMVEVVRTAILPQLDFGFPGINTRTKKSPRMRFCALGYFFLHKHIKGLLRAVFCVLRVFKVLFLFFRILFPSRRQF